MHGKQSHAHIGLHLTSFGLGLYTGSRLIPRNQSFGRQQLSNAALYILLACLEVGSHAETYDKDEQTAHKLLKQDALVAATFDELWKDLCTPGRSCCYVALLALSAVLPVRIWSFFPPLQSSFVSALTLEIVGCDVRADSKSVPSSGATWDSRVTWDKNQV